MPKDDTDRAALEAQLMGGEIEDEDEKPGESLTPEVKAEAGEPEAAPEETIEQIRERLAKVEEERGNLERAMREEREAKKTSERTLQALVERLESVQQERQAQPEVKVAEPPNREDDPAGFLAWQNEQTIARLDNIEKRYQQESKVSKEQAEANRFVTTFQTQLDQYAAQVPDYNDAAAFLGEHRDKELQSLGIYDPQQRQEMLRQDAYQIGAHAMQQGKNPGEMFYALAKLRGYQGKKADTVTTQPAVADKPKVKSLSDISGSAPGNKESLQARAERILAATNLKDVLALNADDMEKLLKEVR